MFIAQDYLNLYKFKYVFSLQLQGPGWPVRVIPEKCRRWHKQTDTQTDRHTDVAPYRLKKDPSAERDGNRPINCGSSLESI